MIKEFEFFHGLVFTRILHATQRPLTLKPFKSVSNSSYVVNDTIGIYIKYSAKRMTPWRFTFKTEHQDEIDLMKVSLNQVFLLLVCNDDGIVCLSYAELKQILDNQHDPIEWISATRRRREMYAVRGSNGELDFKIGQNDFPAKLFTNNVSISPKADSVIVPLESQQVSQNLPPPASSAPFPDNGISLS